MIVRKTWERRAKRYGEWSQKTHYKDVYTGWFLLGVIPLFIDRRTTKVH